MFWILRAGCGFRAGPRVGSIKIAGRGPGREQYLFKLRAAVTKFRPACNSGINPTALGLILSNSFLLKYTYLPYFKN